MKYTSQNSLDKQAIFLQRENLRTQILEYFCSNGFFTIIGFEEPEC